MIVSFHWEWVSCSSTVHARVDRSTRLDFPTAFGLIWGFEATPNLLGKASFS